MIIDTHCHIDLYKNPLKIIQDCERDGIIVLAMTNLPSHFELGYPHVKSFKRIRLALGMHPLFVQQHQKEFPLFLRNLSKTSYIGEVGLDFSREGYTTKEIQLISFEKILKEISNKKKILSLHSRRAEKEVLNLLIENNVKNAIFHWYSGPLYLIDKIAETGYYFSVNYQMTKSDSGRRILKKIPNNNLLTETDGPFTNINGQISRPIDIILILKEIAKVKDLSENEIQKIVECNFKELLKGIK